MQVFTDSDEAKMYRELAAKVASNTARYMPTPMTLEEIMELARKHQAFE